MQDPTLRHVYGSLAELNDTLVTGGAAAMTNAGNNARKLQILDEVSRLIDFKAHRGSGFGPWVGTKVYDGHCRSELYLRADISALDEIRIRPSQWADVVTPVETSDFLLAGIGGYDPPFRKIVLYRGVGYTATVPSHFGTALRGIEVDATWSFPYRTRVLDVTLGDDLDDSSSDVEVSGITDLSPAMTILVDDEQMYVTAVTPAVDMDPATITVERGVNGTTAAEHDDAAPITRYVYHASVHTLALRLAEKRWKSRDAGADGSDGGGDVGSTFAREGEDTIIRRMLKGIALVGQV